MLVACDFCHIKMKSEQIHLVYTNGHDATCCEWCLWKFRRERPDPSDQIDVRGESGSMKSGLSSYDREFLKSCNVRW